MCLLLIQTRTRYRDGMHLRSFVPLRVLTALVVAAVLAACSGWSAAPSPAGPRQIHKIAIAYDISGRGDGGFNDLAYNGAKQAADELGLELKEVTARLDDTDDDRAERLRLLARSGHDAIIGVGFTYAGPMQAVAAEFPQTFFAIVDDGTVDAPNVEAILFAEQEGSYLVGVAAGLKTKTGTVGFVGAVQIPLIQKFEAGYTAGVHAANPAAKVQVTYLSQPPDYSGFGDPPHGKEAALGMYDNGVDIIFAAAGGSGSGVHQAAAETGHWSIGVDADEYLLAPEGIRDHILTSMLKNANVATHEFITQAAGFAFKPGVHTFGLANGGIGYATSGGFIDDITAQLDAYAMKIVAGTIVVPKTP